MIKQLVSRGWWVGCAMVAFWAATAGAAPLYWGGGEVDIADGTALPQTTNELSGVWNDSLANWAGDFGGATYAAFADGVLPVFGPYVSSANDAKVTVRLQADVEVSGLMFNLSSPGGFRNGFTFSNDAPQTITPVGTACTFTVSTADTTDDVRIYTNISLLGQAPLIKAGGGQLSLYSGNPAYSGTVHIMGGVLKLPGLSDSPPGVGGLPAVTGLTVRGFPTISSGMYDGSYFTIPSLSVVVDGPGVRNQLHDDAVITLARGRFEYQGRRNNDPASASAETIQQLVLAPYGVLDIDTAGAGGSSAGQLTLASATAGLDRGARGTLLVAVTGSGNPTTDVIVLNGIAAGALLPWTLTTRAEFMQLNPTTLALETVPSAVAPEDLTTWVAGSDYRIGLGTNGFASSGELGDLTLRSLSIFANTDADVAIASGSTLTLSSGALGFQPVTGTRVARLRGGSLTSGTNELYLNTGDSAASHVMTIDSAIVGVGMDLIKSGMGEIRFTGTVNNTYSGTTYVNAGHLVLGKSGAVSVPGDLVLERGGSAAVQTYAGQFGPGSALTVREDASFSLSSPVVHDGTLTLEGGSYKIVNTAPTAGGAGTGFQFNGGQLIYSSSSANPFNLHTDVGYAGTATRPARWMNVSTGNFTIELDGTNRTFAIEDSATLPAGVAEMSVDVPLARGQGSTTGSVLVKTGAGTLALTATNTYSGGTIISNGVLHVASVRGPALSGLHASLYAFSYAYGSLVSFHAPVATNLVIGQALSGTGVLAGRTVLEIMDAYTILASSYNTATDSYDVAVAALARSGNLGTGPVTLDGGILLVDGGITLTNDMTQNGGAFYLDGLHDGSLTWNAGLLGGTGTLVQAVTAKGAVSPGRDTLAALNFASDLTFDAAGSLAVALGASESDRVLVGGTATLGGALAVTNLDAAPVLGSVYTVLTATAISGTFATTNALPALEAGLAWQVNYSGTEVVLEVVESGGGGSPVLGVSPASLDFGGVQVGSVSNLTLVVTNSGDALLTGTAAASGLPFEVVDGAAYSVAAGGSTSVTVRFTPALGEAYVGEVVFASDGGGTTNALAGDGYIMASATNTSVSLASGSVQFAFNLVSGSLYRVEASTNLLLGAAWTDITGQLTNRTGGSLIFSDTNSAATPMRSYRIVSP